MYDRERRYQTNESESTNEGAHYAEARRKIAYDPESRAEGVGNKLVKSLRGEGIERGGKKKGREELNGISLEPVQD